MTRFAWTFAGLANQGVTTGTPTGVGPSFATAGDVPSLEMPAYPQNFTNICTIQTLPRHLVFPLMGLNFFIQQIGQEAVELHMNESVLTCVVDFVLLDVSSWVPQNSWSDCSWSGQIWPDGVELGLQNLFRRSSKLWKKSWAKKRTSVTGWDAVGTRMPCLARSRRIFARWNVQFPAWHVYLAWIVSKWFKMRQCLSDERFPVWSIVNLPGRWASERQVHRMTSLRNHRSKHCICTATSMRTNTWEASTRHCKTYVKHIKYHWGTLNTFECLFILSHHMFSAYLYSARSIGALDFMWKPCSSSKVAGPAAMTCLLQEMQRLHQELKPDPQFVEVDVCEAVPFLTEKSM